ncbi:5-deoxy-glucuronate isomerase [Aeromicrobium sp. Root495]|uniref:5-deoxy-glucuronate isomerase n=1 Tax=Aeromicrobium sp. Root495 TaxID=1736550 RepID=UPI0006F485E6|nr:5-deoxy-glucuronate isomerase [Aeromicrobium sp. Root495]KQY58724.1 5-deoxy-glucuronate isomerase [Aeromicrobium sp. Root495]
MPQHVIRAGETTSGAVTLEVTPESAGWTHSGLRTVTLAAGESYSLATGEDEVLVLSLGGSADVSVDGKPFELRGRADVWSGPSDVVYAPRESDVTITSAQGGRFALPAARATNRLEPAYLPASDVPVEMRGAGQASRQVNNFGVPGVLEADRIIACEVLTPGGNWSSYPPHKHDEERDGETQLEEIYYFEVAGSPSGTEGVGYQRVYGHEKAEIDILAEVRDGDVVLIPHGWHGPSMAAPGYDLYYLNVMAGPGEERAWLICDDPQHGWVRETWTDQTIDPRLPFGGDA